MLLALALATAAPSASEQAVSLFWQACVDGGMTMSGSISAGDPAEMPKKLAARFNRPTSLKLWKFAEQPAVAMLAVAEYRPANHGVAERCVVLSRTANLEESADRLIALQGKRPYKPIERAPGATVHAISGNEVDGWVMVVRELGDHVMLEAVQLDSATPKVRKTAYNRVMAKMLAERFEAPHVVPR
ncbi:MAG: hypothetical protein KYX69_20735 [Sphingomonas sp.]|uniref:hypothetical protein n=1 Tax=Sphingomonas sp. TaxID=28214 RepID=UPI00262FDE2C|nr:hypothetical protein [Sphingomonas sp.]MDK2770133.1 hypothetical protein [Sphingomonas sp.]